MPNSLPPILCCPKLSKRTRTHFHARAAFGTVLTDRRDGGRLEGDVVVGGAVGLVPGGPGLLRALGAVLDAVALLDLADPVIRPRTHDLGVGPASGGLRERGGKDSRVCIERDDGRFVYVLLCCCGQGQCYAYCICAEGWKLATVLIDGGRVRKRVD